MRLLIVLLFFALNLSAFSQSKFTVEGTLNSESKEVISVGDVLLYQQDQIVAFTSVMDGKFSFDAQFAGKYLLKVICMGYEVYEKEINLSRNLKLTIQLKESSEVLDEVQIKSTKKVLESRSGNILANVEGTILSKETNPADLLSRLPNIQVNPSGNELSILGRGTPLIYIGRQRITMEELLSLSVDGIKSIEIVNNPSAKYEAEGRAVLLITKRKNQQEGMQMTITERASSKTFFNNNLNTNLSLKGKKLEYRFNAAYNQFQVWEKNTAVYEVTDQNVFSDYTVEAVTDRPQFVLGGGVFYAIDEEDYLSFNTRFRSQVEPFTIDTNTFLDDDGSIQDIISTSDNEGFRQFLSSNVNYFKSMGEKQSIFLGAQYTNYTRDVKNNIQNSFNNSMTDQVNIQQDFNVESVVLKADYEMTNEKNTKLEVGTNFANNVSKSLLLLNTDRSSYRYTEGIFGVYSQLSGGKEKFNYSLGVRLENTKVEGGFLQADELLIDRKNTYFFPRASFDYKFSDKKSLNLSFVRSITRPNYRTAVTTTAFINPALEFQGNINLRPRISNEIMANYQMKKASISFRYYHSTDPVNFRFFYDEQRDITIMSPTNFDRETGWAVELLAPFSYKFWSSSNTISFNYNTVDDLQIDQGQITPYVYVYTNQRFKIDNENSLGLNGWFLSNRKDGLFDRREVFTLNATYNTKLFKKLDVTLSVNDIFNTLEFQESYILQNLNVSNLFFTDVNEVAISIRYSFGKVKDSKYKNSNVDEELNRMN